MKYGVKQFALLGCVLFSAGCANMSVGNLFSHYSAQNKQVYQAVQAGDYAEAEQLQTGENGGEILSHFEQGRIAFLAENYPSSLKALEVSDQAIREQQDRATISLSETTNYIGSLAVNDNLNEYYPADYELGFLHLYLGLNYLQKNDLEGALVEMRRANQVQEAAKKAREDELKRAENELGEQGISANLGSVLAHYPDAGKTLSAVQNGYLFYLSGLLYEAARDLNSAYVDYRRALAVMPENTQVIESTMLMAKKLGMKQDLILLEKRYGKTPKPLMSSQGRVILIDEQGIVEALQGWRIDLPIHDSRDDWAVYSLALPYYSNAYQREAPFGRVGLNGQELLSSTLVDVNAMAHKNLNERLIGIIIRQVTRLWTKDRIRKEATQNSGVGNILFNVWNVFSEQPDTRSWQSLPAKVVSASSVVPSGLQRLQINGETYQFEVPAKQTTLVWLSRQGEHSTVWHKQLGRL
ncbi:COG3014 family protein [Vibrio sagamiensis]|uniref:Uncharacterized protein n=1 Tax=Vibrio sagamiensis NBRC 104589 TaxID=1219064 RepID=A0A511QC45_9VIBR|nr:lipoprotein [Vibrio sagamiensis]PNQ70259.1 hypothetical protein C1141_05185 [Vibrio agarivorans]GEM74865.1 hypothetical protein VSA01S_09770 [Vibrio sagamiensis NBRC 104589]